MQADPAIENTALNKTYLQIYLFVLEAGMCRYSIFCSHLYRRKWSFSWFQWCLSHWVTDLCHCAFFLLFLLFLRCDPSREGKKYPVIWIHSLEELYKILTILPGAKLELDAVRINWWSFAKRVEKTSFAKSKSYKPPAGVVRGRLVGIVAAYVWCQEHHWFAFLLYEFYKAETLFCVEVIPKVSVAINHKWNLSADEKP